MPASFSGYLSEDGSPEQTHDARKAGSKATTEIPQEHKGTPWQHFQGPDDSESVVSELIFRLKESISEQAGSWWRASMAKVARRPLLASYETAPEEAFAGTHEIQDELAPVCISLVQYANSQYDMATKQSVVLEFWPHSPGKPTHPRAMKREH